MPLENSYDLHRKINFFISYITASERRLSPQDDSITPLWKQFQSLTGIRDVTHLEFMERLARSEARQKQLQNEIDRLGLITGALTGCNRALVQANTEKEFLSQICEFIIERSGFCTVWIGYALNDPRQTIKLVAFSGLDPEDEKGYASSLALPLILPDGQVLGTLNLCSRDVDYFSNDEIHILSSMAQDISLGIQAHRDRRRHHEQAIKNQRDCMFSVAISTLLETALQTMSLQQQLEAAMDFIIAVPWLTIEPRGGIFLADNDQQKLTLAAQRNLFPSVLKRCRYINYGYCLCGRAAKERTTMFTSCLDERHDVQFPGIQPHGHYCIPIESLGTLLASSICTSRMGMPGMKTNTIFSSPSPKPWPASSNEKKTEEKIKEIAHTDPLTQLPNRADFLELLDHELLRAKRQGGLLSIMFIDMDGFKKINDTHGHQTGDELLMQVGKRIGKCLRQSDVVGRLGGDEFCIILPNITFHEDSIKVAKKSSTPSINPIP